MGQDYYDDRDEYHTGDAGVGGSGRSMGGRSIRNQAKDAAGGSERRASGKGDAPKSRGSHNWPPRSKYRIRPWS